jgi:hypothetical protein
MAKTSRSISEEKNNQANFIEETTQKISALFEDSQIIIITRHAMLSPPSLQPKDPGFWLSRRMLSCTSLTLMIGGWGNFLQVFVLFWLISCWANGEHPSCLAFSASKPTVQSIKQL